MSGKKGADWFEESDRDKMNMLESCERGNLNEVVKLLNGGVDVDEEDDDGVTALQIAAAKGHRSLVEFLIREGAKIDRANYAGMTPFLHACREGHQDIVTLLANHGANIHATTGLGMSAMALACAGRHLAVVRTIKSLNVAVDPKQNARLHQISPSPYMVAFFKMDIQICGFLKQQNAHLWHRVRGMDGLDVARLGQLLGLPEMLMRLNYTESTLKAPEGKNDIRQVVQQGDEQIMAQMLRDGEVPVSLQDGITPLMFATVAGQLRIAEMLIKVGRGGAIDAQENVLGMTALMFAIVAGESPMVLLLLRHGANPRILSTTREPFSALELALFAELSRDCLSQLCAHWLKAGKRDNAMSSNQQSLGVDGRAEQLGNYKRDDQQLASIGRGALTPARIRRVFESIGKNLMGLATEDIGSSLGWPDLMGSSETRPSMESGKSRLECLAECTLLEGPARFVLAEHILRGDARPPTGPKRSSGDTLVQLARQMAISWTSKGHSLELIPTGNGPRAFGSAQQGEERESDGLYSAAQRNAEKELKKRHRYEPARKSSRTPLTPRAVRTAQQERVPKSPSIDAQRTMRKAPLRLSHYRAASGSSQSQTAQSDSPNTTPTTPRPNFFLTQPRFPQPLTKELVQGKLREWNLDKQFQQFFGAEEFDEFTFATLSEEEVRQVLSRHSQTGMDLVTRFVALLQDIKRCTASSELL